MDTMEAKSIPQHQQAQQQQQGLVKQALQQQPQQRQQQQQSLSEKLKNENCNVIDQISNQQQQQQAALNSRLEEHQHHLDPHQVGSQQSSAPTAIVQPQAHSVNTAQVPEEYLAVTRHRRVLTVTGTLQPADQIDSEKSDSQSEYHRHPSPGEYVQMAPRNEEQTAAAIYTYATTENGQQIICTESPGTIKIETIEKDHTTSEPQNLQPHHHQCPTPNGNYPESIVVTSGALSHHHPEAQAIIHTSHPGAHLRFEDDGRFTSDPTLNYYDSGVVDATTNHVNESKTFTDLGNSAYINFASSSPYALGQSSANYSVGHPTQLIYKTDPNLGATVQQTIQYRTSQIYDPVNATISDQSPWGTSGSEYTAVSYNNYHHQVMEDYGAPAMSAPHWPPAGTCATIMYDVGTAMPESLKCENCNGQFIRKGNDLYCSNGCGSTIRTGGRLPPRVTKPKAAAVANKCRAGITCANCQTNSTTLWRRNNDGNPVCNACGLYYKLHNMNRPLSMKKDGIQKRKRKPKNSGGAPMRPLPSMNSGNMVGSGPLYPSQIAPLSIPLNGQHLTATGEIHDISTARSITIVPGDLGSLNAARQHITSETQAQYGSPPSSQSQSPHLSNSSSLNRQITQSVPPIESNRNGSEIVTSVITRTGLPERSSNN